MNYKQLTVFNYKIAYYAMRVFGLYWLFRQYLDYLRISRWPKEIYEPFLEVQRMIFSEYPSHFLYASILILCAVLLVITIFRQSWMLNLCIFLLMAVINFPISLNFSVGHNNHLVILGYFMAIFLLPAKMKSENDYQWVQYFYLGLLTTYSLAGMFKFLGITKNIALHSGKITWIERNAAKINSLDNYWMADVNVPEWMLHLYAYENLWVIVTVMAIIFQAISFLGAFNRTFLTVIMVFLYTFHWYTDFFVLADFKDAKNFVLIALFPYHVFYPLLRNRKIKMLNPGTS
ncbi:MULTISPECIES: hypothetical protein [Chryseobacterium]|uniref:HTTM domain-containing protein n=1 Tax=Chryseobacterium camelliae TaxID=1265445 RepID=A0ABU0TJV2_9FLAO|nr:MULTISPECIES: hypothetical protein [Chryseobacterium]MDT3408827.1 hypothetical protein [Pseudacidovorax intermedius]MDQ1097315.1 hypothetical protein [Chryseobacterium camelliae]MDQ1101249.1 hypothetical protein [Chryseobacterium sp. SORGH_AS_1048]MDR6084694.1 hypothetical protein [Chryseobacterium sp. SORGH_AS_0909]MDR6132967.1 hypothetical protein [Chryseobacterium sp. SORGH_AS_1175]